MLYEYDVPVPTFDQLATAHSMLFIQEQKREVAEERLLLQVNYHLQAQLNEIVKLRINKYGLITVLLLQITKQIQLTMWLTIVILFVCIRVVV